MWYDSNIKQYRSLKLWRVRKWSWSNRWFSSLLHQHSFQWSHYIQMPHTSETADRRICELLSVCAFFSSPRRISPLNLTFTSIYEFTKREDSFPSFFPAMVLYCTVSWPNSGTVQLPLNYGCKYAILQYISWKSNLEDLIRKVQGHEDQNWTA